MVRSVAEPVEQRINIVVVFRAINLFTQRDLEEGKIVFVHSGVSTTRLLLRVSDGQKVRQGQSDSVGTGVCVVTAVTVRVPVMSGSEPLNSFFFLLSGLALVTYFHLFLIFAVKQHGGSADRSGST